MFNQILFIVFVIIKLCVLVSCYKPNFSLRKCSITTTNTLLEFNRINIPISGLAFSTNVDIAEVGVEIQFTPSVSAGHPLTLEWVLPDTSSLGPSHTQGQPL